MTADDTKHRRKPRKTSLREVFILTAMTVVALAVGVGLAIQLAWPLWAAAATATALYVALISTHVMMRRSEAIAELSDEIERLEGEVSWIRHQATPSHGAAPAAKIEPTLRAPKPATADAAKPAKAAAPATDKARTPVASPTKKDEKTPAAPAAVNRPELGDVRPKPASAASDTAIPDAWSFRPTGPQPKVGAPQASAPAIGPAVPAPTSAPAAASANPRRSEPKEPSLEAAPSPRAVASDKDSAASQADPQLSDAAVAGDVEMINGIIRKFAEEMTPPAAAASPVLPPAAQAGAAPATDEDAAISASVEALRAAADEMRRPVSPEAMSPIERGILPPLKADSAISGSPPPPLNPGHARLAAITDSLATGSFDVYLEPVAGLSDRKVRHHEITLRLKWESGGSLGAREYVPATRGTGMLPMIDALRLTRASTMARHMDERGIGGALFATVSAEALISQGFIAEFGEVCRQSQRLSERLVLLFDHADVRSFTSAHWTTIRQLSEAGFRLGIDDAQSLDLDLPDMKNAGFAFIRINARSLMDGVPSLEGPLTAADVNERLTGTGLSLIVVGLEDNAHLASALDAGIPLGQGPLFGPRLPIKAQALQPARSVAA